MYIYCHFQKCFQNSSNSHESVYMSMQCNLSDGAVQDFKLFKLRTGVNYIRYCETLHGVLIQVIIKAKFWPLQLNRSNINVTRYLKIKHLCTATFCHITQKSRGFSQTYLMLILDEKNPVSELKQLMVTLKYLQWNEQHHAVFICKKW